MPRINLTVDDDNYQFLKQMRDSGKAASLSHAVRLTIQEYRKLHGKPKKTTGRGGSIKDGR